MKISTLYCKKFFFINLKSFNIRLFLIRRNEKEKLSENLNGIWDNYRIVEIPVILHAPTCELKKKKKKT